MSGNNTSSSSFDTSMMHFDDETKWNHNIGRNTLTKLNENNMKFIKYQNNIYGKTYINSLNITLKSENCPICSKDNEKGKMLCCHCCSSWYHITCINIPQYLINKWKKKYSQYICFVCEYNIQSFPIEKYFSLKNKLLKNNNKIKCQKKDENCKGYYVIKYEILFQERHEAFKKCYFCSQTIPILYNDITKNKDKIPILFCNECEYCMCLWCLNRIKNDNK